MALRERLLPTRGRKRPETRLSLREMREQLGVRRADIANRLGRTPQAVLQFEQGLDPKVGTLADYIRALADEIDSVTGELTVTATFDDRSYQVDLVPQPADSQPDSSTPTQAAPAKALNAWKIGSATWFTPDEVGQMLAGGYIAMSEDEIDVNDNPTDRELALRLRAAPREVQRQSSDRAIQTFVRYWRTFLTSVRVGDVVVLPRHTGNIAIGLVTGNPSYAPDDPDPKLRHRRTVEWFAPDTPKQALPEDLRRSVSARGTIGRIRADNAAARLQHTAR